MLIVVTDNNPDDIDAETSLSWDAPTQGFLLQLTIQKPLRVDGRKTINEMFSLFNTWEFCDPPLLEIYEEFAHHD